LTQKFINKLNKKKMKKFFSFLIATFVAVFAFASTIDTTSTNEKVSVKFYGLFDNGWSSQAEMVTITHASA